MPYIKQEERDVLDPLLEPIMSVVAQRQSPGWLNYVITRMAYRYINATGGVSYRLINEVVGALECAKQEFYRVPVSSYEDKKMCENGAVS